MPRAYKRTSDKGRWDESDIIKAKQLIKDGVSTRQAAKSCGIPYSTLKDRVQANNMNSGPQLGAKCVFTPEQEKQIAERCIAVSKIFHGITSLGVRRAAFEFAVKNKIKHNFNAGKRLAGMDWFSGFLRRNPTLSIRQPQSLSLNRISSFNREEVDRFFTNLQSVMEEHNFEQARIYNVDETGTTIVNLPDKIVAEKGAKRVGTLASGERGRNVTVICAFNALGSYIPPLFVFPRKRMTFLLSKDGPAGAAYFCSDNGWSNEDIFVEWLKHFVKHSNATVKNPVLLVLDNHSSHCSLKAYDFCKKNGIVMLSLPPHSSHRMQPLDVSFFGPLKKAFRSECDLQMKNNSFQKLTHYDVASLFNKAYSRVATIAKGIAGFKASGIFPINPNVFTNEDFLGADALNGEGNNKQNDTKNKVIVPSYSGDPNRQPHSNLDSPSIDDILPIPSTSKRQTRASVRKGHSEIVTALPRKLFLEKEKDRKGKKRKQQTKQTKRQTKRFCKKAAKRSSS